MAKKFLITASVPYIAVADRGPQFEASNGKYIGECPLSGKTCTDVRARHHTTLVTANTQKEAWDELELAWAARNSKSLYLIRIEEV